MHSDGFHFTMILQRANFGGVSMDAFFSHMQELLSQGYTQVLIGLYIVAQIWWWLKKAIGSRAPRYKNSFNGKYSVIVVAYRPDPTRLSRTLKSIAAYGSPTEIIVAIDDAPHAPKKLKTIAAKYATRVIEAAQKQGPRELYAKAAEALKKRSDVIITVAPGAVWDETTASIIAPFADDTIGAVSGHEIIVRPAGFIQNLGAWLNRTYFDVIMPFQSALGAVRPLSPHIMAVRRDIFTTSAIASRNETFLGRRVITAFSESITASVLAAGQRTTYQAEAAITVPTAETLGGLRRTYLQRYRGSIRSLIRNTKAATKTNILITASALFSLFSPVIYLSALAAIIFIVAYGIHQYTTDITSYDIVIFSILTLIEYVVLSYIRHYSTIRTKQSALWLPAYLIVGGLMILWAKTLALFTFAENTRHYAASVGYGEGKVGRARTAAAGFAAALFLIALPLAYFALVKPQNVPLNVITSQQGRPFALAREYGQRLQDANAQNDPSTAELVEFIRANSAFYGQSVNEDIAESSLLCVRDAIKTSSMHGALDNAQACYAHAATIAQESDPHTHVADRPGEHDDEHPHMTNTIIKVSAKAGDTLTWLLRTEVKKSDTKKELSAAQAVYIETTYLSQTQQLDRHMHVNEQVEINLETLETITKEAKQLTTEQLAAWECYAQNIIW